jgi:hypothetical protein
MRSFPTMLKKLLFIIIVRYLPLAALHGMLKTALQHGSNIIDPYMDILFSSLPIRRLFFFARHQISDHVFSLDTSG